MSHAGFVLAHDMGSGKTLSALALILERGHQKVLTFAPRRVLSTWVQQVREHVGDAITPITATKGTVAQRAQYMAQQLATTEGPAMVILNYETVARKTKMRDWLRSVEWDLLIMDESHRIKSPGGTASKWVATLAGRIPYRLALTGTPMPNSPLDLYAQFRAIDPMIFGTSYAAFRNRYAITHPEFRNKVLEYLNQDDLHARFYSRAHRVETADVIDLPERTMTPLYVELGKKAQQVYAELEGEFYTWIEESDEEVTVANALVKLLRLQQLTGGVLHTDEGNIHRVDNAKSDALASLFSDLPTTEPVVVFAQFHADLDAIREASESTDRRYGEISGRVNDEGYAQWQAGEIDTIGVQIQSGGEGLNDLVRARLCVFWSTGFSLGRFSQARARLLRPGQNRNVTEYHLIAEKTVDEQVFAALRNKQEVVDSILHGSV